VVGGWGLGLGVGLVVGSWWVVSVWCWWVVRPASGLAAPKRTGISLREIYAYVYLTVRHYVCSVVFVGGVPETWRLNSGSWFAWRCWKGFPGCCG